MSAPQNSKLIQQYRFDLLAGQVLDMKRALKLPLDNYEATKAMLQGVPAQLAFHCIASL